jgi:prepilin-type N-terminal cleavage/methylation domain-containing protein
MKLRVACAGFSLTELSMVLAIVGLLLGGLMYTMLAQVEQRGAVETQQRLEMAREYVLAFAIAKLRLPCPARDDSGGDETINAQGECKDLKGAENYYAGLLPARAIGLQPVDAQGYAIDAWGNRIRYAVAKTVTGCAGTATLPHFTHAANLKANGITCQPSDLLVCKSAAGISATSCGPASNVLTNQNVVVAIVWSAGKNFAVAGAYGADESANLNPDAVFVSHPPAPAGAAGGAFDDVLVWIPVGVLYARLIAAGILP